MSWNQIKELKERKAKLLKEGRSILDRAEKENRSSTSEETAAWEAINKDIDALDLRIGNLEKQYERENAPAGDGERRSDYLPSLERPKDEDANKRAWDNYLRRGNIDPSIMADTEFRDALGVGSLAVGPQDFYEGVIAKLKTYAGVIEAGAEIITTTNGAPFPMLTSDDTGNVGQIVAENTEETNKTIPTIGNKTLNAYLYSSKIIPVSIQLTQDAGFDLDGHIRTVAAERIGRALNAHTTTGDDSGKPNGVVTASTLGKTAAADDAITADELIDLVHSVDPAYRKDPSCGFMWHDNILATIRKLKDTNTGQYLLQPGLSAGVPDRVLGFRYTVNNDMASALAASTKAVLFGAFSRYKVRMVRGVAIMQLRERYAEFFQVGYLGFLRADGELADTSAIKHLITAAA